MDDSWIIAVNDDNNEWLKWFTLDGSNDENLTGYETTEHAREALMISGWFLASTIANLLMEMFGVDCTVYAFETHCSEEEIDELPF